MYRKIQILGLAALIGACRFQTDPISIENLSDTSSQVDVSTKNWNFDPVANSDQERKYQTVESVIKTYEQKVLKSLDNNFKKSKVKYENLQLALVAIKDEMILEVYARNDEKAKWKKFKTYPFTAFSGGTGPKLKQGDRQIPEGVYRIESLNPNSKYHLSLRLSYPNSFDKEKAKVDGRTNLGGDIMIHGRDVTIGCIPIGDEGIEELFVLAAKSIKHKIPVLIAPQDFRKDHRHPDVLKIEWERELYKNLHLKMGEFQP